MTVKDVDAKVCQFISAYVKSKEGVITQQADDVLAVTYPNETGIKEYTFLPARSKEKKIPLITAGSPIFQQILKECQENGVLCQVQLNPKGNLETVVKEHFKESPFNCENCHTAALGDEEHRICVKFQPCYHQINNGRIASVKVTKKEPVRYFQFYYSVAFRNKLRPKNEELISVLVDENGDFDASEANLFGEAIVVKDFKGKIKPEVFEALKAAADDRLKGILRGKVALFDLPLNKEKNAKLRSFDKRLRRERREHVISKKVDFDYPKWQANYQALLEREEESYTTNIAVKFINLMVINTAKIKFEITLDNDAKVDSSLILGVDHTMEVNCPLCKKIFTEGYATQDSLYVCGGCVRQSIDTGKIYSKKAPLTFDDKLKGYIEPDTGFVCSVCGKKYSRLLEFKCSHDNSSVCINHYDLCDVCGKPFSKLNLTYTDEFKRQLCPKHAVKGKER